MGEILFKWENLLIFQSIQSKDYSLGGYKKAITNCWKSVVNAKKNKFYDFAIIVHYLVTSPNAGFESGMAMVKG